MPARDNVLDQGQDLLVGLLTTLVVAHLALR